MKNLPKDKHALVIQGSEEEKKKACIEIRDWAVENEIPMHRDLPDYNFKVWNAMVWNEFYLDTVSSNSIDVIERLSYTIHNTVDSFKKVFEVEKSVPTPFGEAIILLKDLADLQNGAPLEQHRKEWEETMEKVYAFLNRWDKPIELKNLTNDKN